MSLVKICPVGLLYYFNEKKKSISINRCDMIMHILSSCMSQMGRWPVLHDRPTVASLHRSVCAPRRSVPHDSLDLHLLSCYQHNREIFPDTSDVIRHPSRLEYLALYVTYLTIVCTTYAQCLWVVLDDAYSWRIERDALNV